MQKGITFVGLDVHSKRIAIAQLPPGSGDVTSWDIANEPKAIRRTFKRLVADAYELRCCYEAGPCGFEVHRLLTSMGIACDVVAPGLIPVKTGTGSRRTGAGERSAVAPEE